MMCHRIGRPPISIMGLGRTCVSSLIRVPIPPARMTAFMNDAVASSLTVLLDTQDRADRLRAPRKDRPYDSWKVSRVCSPNRVALRRIVNTDRQQTALVQMHDHRIEG